MSKSIPESTLTHYEKYLRGDVWFGDKYALQFTRIMSYIQKAVWFALIRAKGLIQHEYYRNTDELYEVCEDYARKVGRFEFDLKRKFPNIPRIIDDTLIMELYTLWESDKLKFDALENFHTF